MCSRGHMTPQNLRSIVRYGLSLRIMKPDRADRHASG